MRDYIFKNCSKKQEEFLVDKIVEYNLTKVPLKQEETFTSLSKVIEIDNEIVGGIVSRMYCWNCLYIDTLWVKEEYRNNGFGKVLLKEIERIAKEKGCYLIHLDTFTFQAKDFYIKYGYEIFGVLDDCPKGFKRYFLKKNI